MAKRPPPAIRYSKLPEGVQYAGALRIERQQARGKIVDVLQIPEKKWLDARYRFQYIKRLAEQTGPQPITIDWVARILKVTPRTVQRWLRSYRKNPDVMALIPQARGPTIGHRRIIPELENLLRDVIDDWVRSGQRLPITWIREECKRRGQSSKIKPPSRGCIVARLRDRGLEALRQRRVPKVGTVPVSPEPRPPRSPAPLRIVQMDHTLVDVMVVDEIRRESMGRPWITIAFDIATRAVLGFHLSLHPPSAVSVGLALAMASLPKDRWLAERGLELDWPMHGLPKTLHLDNGPDFRSVALSRGCERYGISLEYRPPGRPHFGGHIERYLGTLMRRIHGLPGTTFSNPVKKGKYRSEAKATMTMAELERWIALEIAGRYHFYVHSGVHAVPNRLWKRLLTAHPVSRVQDPDRFLLDFLPAEMRKVGRDGFQVGRIRYWDPLVSRLFPSGTRILVRYNPRDLSKVFVPSPDQSEYLCIPYADLRRPPITKAELDRSRAVLTTKGDATPSEDAIFATAAALRKLEDAAAKSTRRARRKSEQWDGTFYQEDWTHAQIGVVAPEVISLGTLLNGGTYRVRGFETSADLRAAEGLTIRAGGAWNDSALRIPGTLYWRDGTPVDFSTLADFRGRPVLNPTGVPGTRLAGAPSFQGNIRVRYERELAGYESFVQVSAVHQSSSRATTDELRVDLQGKPIDYDLPSFTKWNLAFGVGHGAWQAQLAADNLTDARAISYANYGQYYKGVTVARPRTIGLRLTLRTK